VQAAARQDVRGEHHIQLALLEGRLRVEGHAGLKVHFNLRPLLTEILQRRGQPLNTAMTFDGDAKGSLLRLMARLQRLGYLRQHLVRQLQQDFTLRGKAQRLAFTYE